MKIIAYKNYSLLIDPRNNKYIAVSKDTNIKRYQASNIIKLYLQVNGFYKDVAQCYLK